VERPLELTIEAKRGDLQIVILAQKTMLERLPKHERSGERPMELSQQGRRDLRNNLSIETERAGAKLKVLRGSLNIEGKRK
jgi:hypothetical protein